MNWRKIHIHIPRQVRWILIAIAVLAVVRLSLPGDNRPRQNPTRVEQVRVIDWRSVDSSVRKAFEAAHDKACAHAEAAVRQWMNELRRRSEEDFLPWHFAYWNQQALMLRTLGWYLMDTPLIEGMLGRQASAADQMGSYLQAAFTARVLQPGSAQLRVESITREAVEIYLQALNEELRAVQVEYAVSDQDWERHLSGLAAMLRSVEGNRQVPLVLKGMVVAGGSGAVKVGRAVARQVRYWMMRRGGRELMEDSMYYGGRVASRGLGWAAFVVFGVWDLYDHHRTVQQNTPVMRGVLNGYFDELENQVLNDPQCGIYSVLESVRQSIAGRYKEP